MKILYGVQGTGNGHISRSREIIKALRRHGHEVHTLFSGRKKELLKDVSDFEPYEVKKGLTFSIQGGKIKYFRTAMQLDFMEFYKSIHYFRMPEKHYDLILTDFEPVTARFAKKHRLPSIGIGHQYAFLYDIPAPGGSLFSRLVMKNYATAQFSIGLHWHHFNHPILPPIVPRVHESGKKIENKILVYLPFEDIARIKTFLLPFKKYDFYIYASLDTGCDSDHLHFRPFSRTGFIEDLLNCSGVLCNAGFELPSEALHLGKKILVRPLQGQFEQHANAYTLSHLNIGMEMRSLDKKVLEKWLASDSSHPKNYPDVAGMVAEWITGGKWEDVSPLFVKAWRS